MSALPDLELLELWAEDVRGAPWLVAGMVLVVAAILWLGRGTPR